jgi:hypothetical protein
MKSRHIGFDGLTNSLNFTANLAANPGSYVLYSLLSYSTTNCVTKTVHAGAAAGLTYPNDVTPQNFGIDLNLMPPSDLLPGP